MELAHSRGCPFWPPLPRRGAATRLPWCEYASVRFPADHDHSRVGTVTPAVHIGHLSVTVADTLVREGVERTRQAPPGIYLIRADPMKRPDVGDDALVEYMNRAIDQGIPASDCILVTDDRALRGRMRIGVEKRKNSWLHSELQGFSGSVTWHRQLSPTPTRAARRENQVKWENRVKWRCLAPRRREHCRQEPRPVGPSAAPRDCQHHVQKAPPVEQSSWWHGWFASLRSLFVGSRDENKSVTERR